MAASLYRLAMASRYPQAARSCHLADVRQLTAGLGVDRDHDAADRDAGRRVACPVLLLEAARDDLDSQGSPADIWAPWLSRPPRHRIIDSGHHQAEQAPDAVASALLEFLAEAP
jgi:haloacetate dehalogenase